MLNGRNVLVMAAMFGLGSGVVRAQVEAERLLSESDFKGGLIVTVNPRDAKVVLTLAGKAPGALVHGLVTDPAKLETLRRDVRDAGRYGRVSMRAWSGPTLPYTDDMVNVLVIEGETTLERKEINRVLAPGGTAWLAGAAVRKPLQEGVDVWTHVRYDATGNAVSRDTRAGPPRFLQWEALPRWNAGTKTSGLVAANGRIFYILNDAHFNAGPPAWTLIARDAFNGIEIWRHALTRWPGAREGKKVGPAQVNRRLVAVGDRVYATLGAGTRISVLDAGTGKILRELKDTAQTAEFVVSNGVLVALVGPGSDTGMRREKDGRKSALVAAAPETGALLWRHDAEFIMPLSVVADGKQVLYHDGKAIKSLDLKRGSPLWTSPPTGQKIVYRKSANSDSPGAEKGAIWLAPQFALTILMYKGVVAFAGGRRIKAYSAEDGRELWSADFAASNYSVPVDLFGYGGYLWGPDEKMNLWRPTDDDISFNAYDLKTGEIRKRIKGRYNYRFQHHRCHQMKVVDGTILAGRAGIEFVDMETGETAAHHWIRGSCYYGVMPANGILYIPPHNCACYIRAKVSGFMALRSARPAGISETKRLMKGPAYGKTAENAAPVQPDEWPTYRHDMARSGRTEVKVGTDLLMGWKAEPGGRLTSPVIAGNRLYVASSDTHRLHALDAETGKTLWHYDFDARVDSPPTVAEGLVLCGCRDGTVHALRAKDGALAWRYFAAPEERMIVSRGQLESVWPISGSLLVLDKTVYATAGKSSYLDGGMHLIGLGLHDGRELFRKVLDSRDEKGAEQLDKESVEGFLNDILSSDGKRLFMRHQAFDLQGKPVPERVTHLYGADGYLSGDTTTRLLWTYAPVFTSRHQGAFYDQRLSRLFFPSGRILVEGKDAVYGYGPNHYGKLTADAGGIEALFAAPKKGAAPVNLTAREYRTLALKRKQLIAFRWWKRVPVCAWAMVSAGESLYVAGSRSRSTSREALEGKEAGGLLAVSQEDGSVQADMILPAMPTWDGMAVANGNLYLSLASGHVVCLWSAKTGKPGERLETKAVKFNLPPVKIAEEKGLVGRWRFDEGQGPVARDCSGKGHDATVSGRWGKDTSGAHLIAEAEPGAVVIPDAKHLQFGNDSFTLAFWVKVEAYNARLIGKEGFPEEWWVINLPEDGRPELVVGEGTGSGKSLRLKTKSPIEKNSWTHLAAVVDRKAGEVRWYVNGGAAGRVPLPATMKRGVRAEGRDISIPSRHKPFRGGIRDLRIYRQALDAEQVKGLAR